tara:strand:+ start:1904 stop:2119 length:216 start_codon:yes stop_codon:yes gene_type:complete
MKYFHADSENPKAPKAKKEKFQLSFITKSSEGLTAFISEALFLNTFQICRLLIIKISPIYRGVWLWYGIPI